MNSNQKVFRKRIALSLLITLFTMLITLFIFVSPAIAAEEAESLSSIANEHQAEVVKWEVIAAAIAFGLGALGAGMAISRVGSAAMGAMSEKPEVGSQALIFVAMAEGIAVFGFIAALMILGKF
ncbi:MAG TPA: ATP synthase subunit C [Spirochaetota bacterium]|nr:ATP synthase subunit C [Spirochaetota bacterium]